jgi:shikimate dehydrogenase
MHKATQSTMYFIGVTTNKSSIMQVFPKWSEILGLNAVLLGYDAPLYADASVYETIIKHIKTDPLVKGALVTTHKLDLLSATRDYFDELDPYATLTSEVSSISKRNDKLIGHAKDPISSGLALEAFVPQHYWQNNAHVLCFGAGGAAVAISLYFINQKDNQPKRIVITDISLERLEHIQHLHQKLKSDIQFEYILNSDPAKNDMLMSQLPEASLVINATGMGKDRPGSPISDAAVFPKDGLVWELNYRGELDFLKQAQKQSTKLNHIEDGWVYFLHGWTQVVAEVFDFSLTSELFAKLDEVASQTRG